MISQSNLHSPNFAHRAKSLSCSPHRAKIALTRDSFHSCAFHRGSPAVDLVALQLSRRPVHRVCFVHRSSTDRLRRLCVCVWIVCVWAPRSPFPLSAHCKRYRSFYGHFRDCAPWVFRDIFSLSWSTVTVLGWSFGRFVAECFATRCDCVCVVVVVQNASRFLDHRPWSSSVFFSSTLSSRRI